MVDSKGDIPDESDVAPKNSSRAHILEEILDTTEVVVTLSNGQELELHGHDTYIEPGDSVGIVYTKEADDDVWFYADEIVTMVRHYD